MIKRSGAISIVDGVAAFGGVPEPMHELGIDVLLTGAQKALGVPPGLAIWGSERRHGSDASNEPVRFPLIMSD